MNTIRANDAYLSEEEFYQKSVASSEHIQEQDQHKSSLDGARCDGCGKEFATMKRVKEHQ